MEVGSGSTTECDAGSVPSNPDESHPGTRHPAEGTTSLPDTLQQMLY